MPKFSSLAIAIALCMILGSGWAQEPSQNPSARTATEKTPQGQRTARYVEKEIFVPTLKARPQGLDVLEVYVDLPGRHPLVVLTHGSSVDHAEHAHVTPWAQLNQALWFARRGYVVLVVVRQGYGRSGGEEDGRHGGCGSQGSFEEAG